ncbi:MAG: hypothetical protein ACO218_06380, partial [Steroidobacteraceae bacterium]
TCSKDLIQAGVVKVYYARTWRPDERVVDCRVSPVHIDDAALLVEITDVTRRTQISRENALLIQHGAGRHQQGKQRQRNGQSIGREKGEQGSQWPRRGRFRAITAVAH